MQLYEGIVSARLYKYAEVRRPFPVDLRVCGLRVPECTVTETPGPQPAGAQAEGANPPAAMPAPRGARTPLGPVLVGGRVHAELTSYETGVDITPAGPSEQMIASPTDIAEWRWTVLATKAGRLTFQITVTTLKGDTTEPLYPTRYFDVAMDVRDTLGNQAAKAGRAVNNFFVGAGVGIAALATAVLAYLGYRRRHRTADDDQDEVTEPLATVPSTNTPVSSTHRPNPRPSDRSRRKRKT
ncbi:hypothetical protein [Micromonospora chersina]|uniref:hypothetical protein n=1 Tax=Micromonospora chersina TaxID=47854 RepID=UPI0036C75461